MSMHPHTARTDIGGDSEVRKPQVLDVDVSKGGMYGRVELSTGEHRGRWVR